MHVPVNEAEFFQDLSGYLGFFYLTAALLNAGAAWYWWTVRRRIVRVQRGAGHRVRADLAGLAMVRYGPVLCRVGTDRAQRRRPLDAVDILSPVGARFSGSNHGAHVVHGGEYGGVELLLHGPQVLLATGSGLGWAELGVALHGAAR